jgi:Protein of unknown function (DUF4238)
MPQNKSHHFVPQFLLRFFSTDGSSVGLYNLRSGKIVTGASLKHQACRDWFYGRDGKVEHALGEIEGGSSTVLRRMIETGRPPKRYSDDHRVLATSCSFSLRGRPRRPPTPMRWPARSAS